MKRCDFFKLNKVVFIGAVNCPKRSLLKLRSVLIYFKAYISISLIFRCTSISRANESIACRYLSNKSRFHEFHPRCRTRNRFRRDEIPRSSVVRGHLLSPSRILGPSCLLNHSIGQQNHCGPCRTSRIEGAVFKKDSAIYFGHRVEGYGFSVC